MVGEQIQGVPPGLTEEPIQGVPPGLTAEPIQQAAQPQVEGVPPGLTAEPIAPTYSSGQQAQTGDYQIRKGGPVINVITAGQKPGTITHHNPITPLPGEEFQDTMKRAIDAAKHLTPDQIKEDADENLREAPATLASAYTLGATGPVIYGGAKGVSILKQALVGGDSQILGHPENLMTPESRKAHPYWAGALETVGGLSTPETAAMMIGGGKLGKLPGPAAKVASRLVSGGFGLTMLANAVKNVPELWDVMRGTGRYEDMSDDDRESIAKNLMFHITTDAAMGAQAVEHGATGTSTPLTEYGEAADMMASKAAQAITSTVGKVPTVAINSIGSMLGRTNDFDTAIKRSSKIPSKQVAAHMEKIANVREDLQSILNDNPSVEDPKSFADRINEHIQNNETKLQREAKATKGSDEPVVPDITQRLIERLNKFFDDSKGLYGDTSDVLDAKKRILEGILQSRNGQHLLEPNLFEAENVRRRFSRQGQPQFATNAVPTTDAFKAGSLEAADELRKAIDESYDSKNVSGVREWRSKEANLIDIRDKLYDAQDKAEKMGEGSVFRSLMKKIGIPSTVIAIGLGHPISGAAVGAAVLGDQIAGNLTNPNVNIARAQKIASMNPGASTTVPMDTRSQSPLHPAIASHYGELLGQSTYPELEGRFMAEIAGKVQRGQPLEPNERKILDQLNIVKQQEMQARQKLRDEARKLIPPAKSATLPDGHVDVSPVEGNLPNNMGTQEALIHELAHAHVGAERGIEFLDGIRSGSHSENKNAGSALSIPIDWSDFIGEDGKVDHAKVNARAADLAATYVAGGVANDLWHGIPFTENEGLSADLSILKTGLRNAGFSPADVSKLIAQAVDDATTSLSRPNVREILEQHAQVREPGLDSRHHFSQERLEQVLQDTKDETNGKSTAKSGKSKPGSEKAGGKPTEANAGVGGTAKEPGAGGKAASKEVDTEKLRQQGQGPSEREGGGAEANAAAEPKSRPGLGTPPEEFKAIQRPEGGWPKKGEEPEGPENPKFAARYKPGDYAIPHKFEVEIEDQDGGTHTETIEGYSRRDAIDKGMDQLGNGRSIKILQELPHETGDYQVPKGKIKKMPDSGTGKSELGTIHHELGHIFGAHLNGIKTDGIITSSHPQLRSQGGGRAAARIDFSNFKDIQGRVTRESIGDRLPQLMEAMMGGIAADEVHSGISRESNPNYTQDSGGSDRNRVKNILTKVLGLTDNEADTITNNALDSVKEKLNHPVTRQIAEENAPFREKGLRYTHHFSPERIESMMAEHGRRMAEYGKPGQPEQPNVAGGGRAVGGGNQEVLPGGQAIPGAGTPPALQASAAAEAGSNVGLDNPKLSAQLDAHEKEGGSTFTPEGENLAGRDLYAVGAYPERTLQVDKLTPEVLQKFKSDNADLLAKGDHAVGTWKDPGTGKSVLDISKTHTDRDAAVAAGKAANQKAIYHLGGEGEIPTGGTGETGSPKLMYHPDLQKLADHFGTSEDPSKLRDGASFIAPDGKFIHLTGATTHDSAVDWAKGQTTVAGDNRVDFLRDTGAVRTRFNPKDRAGATMHVSVPEQGATREQIPAIQQAVAQAGRNSNVVFERADVTPETKDALTMKKEFPKPSETEDYLRQISAHPEQQSLNPKLSPKGSSVPLMRNPLKIEGTSDADKINTLDVAKALNQFTTKKIGALELGKAEPQEMVDRAKKLAEDEAKYQMHQNNSGEAWYTKDIKIHDDILREMRPELADPAKLSLFKMSEAVLSSGQKPYGNLKAAVRAWDHYNETGEFSPTNPNTGKSWGPRGVDAYGNAMQMINKLIQEKGEKGASDWLLSEHPVSELRQYNKDASGKANDNALGAMVLGEKRGPFAQNLHGIESAFTADMWVARTWNRWMGTIGIDPKGGQTGKGEITTDAPRNNTERQLMKQSFSETAEKLGLSTSALQAVLWYYEQNLYSVHGSAKESWSFSGAAQRIQAEHAAEAAKPQERLFGEEPPAKSTAPKGQTSAIDFMKLLGSK